MYAAKRTLRGVDTAAMAQARSKHHLNLEKPP